MEKEIKLSEHNQKTLMIAATQEIFEAADNTIRALKEDKISEELSYPPDNGFNDELNTQEIEALKMLKDIPHLDSALKKVIVGSSGSAFFHFFNFLDGTSDPDKNFGEWTWATLVDHPHGENDPYTDMLHDSFYDAYLDWKELKNSQETN